MVWSANVETGEVELKEVTEVFVNEDNVLVHLTINGEVINTTALHPFYVVDKGWTEAIEINVGDKVLLQNGTTSLVEDKTVEQLENLVKVYNFTVDDFHTYFVGEDRVLVHNANCSNPSVFSETGKVQAKNDANKNNSRPLNKKEKQNLFDILEKIIPAANGDSNAINYLNKMGEHDLVGNYDGWKSVYLSPDKGSDNIMRLIYKKDSNGFKFNIVQWH